MRTVIVVCRTVESLNWLDSVYRDPAQRVVIASDDPMVHAKARRHAGVAEVVFLEKMESFYAVAQEVVAILALVNDWLASIETQYGIKNDLLYWISHCEGGDTTQRIQDAVLLIHSYNELIDRLGANELCIVRSAVADWEDTLFADCAQSAGLTVTWIGRLGVAELLRRGWLRYRPLAKEVYFSIGILRGWLRGMFRERLAINTDRMVAVEVCGSEQKHLKNCLPLLAAIDKSGMDGVAFCWSAGRASSIIRREGLRAVDLEDSVSLRVLIESWVRTTRSWFRARSMFDKLLSSPSSTLHARLVRPIMLKSVRSFFHAEVAQRFRLDAASRSFFSRYPARAASFWTRILPQGVIAYKAVPSASKPIVFWQPNPDHLIPNPYERYDIPVDLIFVASEEHKRVFAQHTNPDNVIVVGLQWWTEILKFQQMYTQAASRTRLGILDRTELCLLFDAGAVFRGYRTSEEVLTVLSELIELARSYPQMRLMIKPHPSHKSGLLEESIGRNPLPNITLIPKDALPFHALNAADVLVTKFSTMIVEGLILGLPSICVMLDHEKRFSYVGDVVEYQFTTTDFREFVAKLITSPQFRSAWYERRRDAAARYLREYAPQPGVNPYDTIANAIKNRLSCTS